MDATALAAAELGEFCRHLLRSGCAYLCTWGPDCERVHDVMDQAVVGENPPDTYLGCVMTTWHEKESLIDALEYFFDCTLPDSNLRARRLRLGFDHFGRVVLLGRGDRAVRSAKNDASFKLITGRNGLLRRNSGSDIRDLEGVSGRTDCPSIA